jgi:Na+-transporting NADH:ubiquinone oxidoreductase subunit A
MIQIKKGLDIPLAGGPRQEVDVSKTITRVAVLGADYVGMKPTMLVAEGETVAKGQPLFEDKRNPGVFFVAPVSGVVSKVDRGEKRLFRAVVIDRQGDTTYAEIPSLAGTNLESLTHDTAVDFLTKSGLWTALRQRPYSKIPAPASMPHSIFVTAIDTNPHAPNPAPIIAENSFAFIAGLKVLKPLTTGQIFLCKGAEGMIPGYDLNFINLQVFSGPHPAGLPGTHIHILDPVTEKKSAWYINYQDVIAIGKLALTGTYDTNRIISLAGPAVKNPRLLRVPLGSLVDEITNGELIEGDNRIISGCVLSGRQIVSPFNYLSRYHLQVSALREGRERVFLGWQGPGFDKFSITKVFASTLALMSGENKTFEMTTSTEGSKRAMVPIGGYEAVMPLDLLPTQLLRSLLTYDDDLAIALGALELDEEDLALCTFVCPSKYEYGSYLRAALTRIETEG